MILLLAATFLSGCATSESLLSKRGRGGNVFTCQAEYGQVYDEVLHIFKKERLRVIRRDRKKGEIIGGDTIRFLNGGGRIAVFLHRRGPSDTKVEVHSEPFLLVPLPTYYISARKRGLLIREELQQAFGPA